MGNSQRHLWSFSSYLLRIPLTKSKNFLSTFLPDQRISKFSLIKVFLSAHSFGIYSLEVIIGSNLSFNFFRQPSNNLWKACLLSKEIRLNLTFLANYIRIFFTVGLISSAAPSSCLFFLCGKIRLIFSFHIKFERRVSKLIILAKPIKLKTLIQLHYKHL